MECPDAHFGVALFRKTKVRVRGGGKLLLLHGKIIFTRSMRQEIKIVHQKIDKNTLKNQCIFVDFFGEQFCFLDSQSA